MKQLNALDDDGQQFNNPLEGLFRVLRMHQSNKKRRWCILIKFVENHCSLLIFQSTEL